MSRLPYLRSNTAWILLLLLTSVIAGCSIVHNYQEKPLSSTTPPTDRPEPTKPRGQVPQPTSYPYPQQIDNAYPVGEETAEPVGTVVSYYAALTIEPDKITPTVDPLTPHPPSGWPTDQPWPPSTSTPMTPQPTPTVDPFPTPQIRPVEGAVDTLYSLWYPAYAGINATPLLAEVNIDACGYRSGPVQRQIDVGMMAKPMYRDTGLYGIYPSPDGAYMMLDISDQEMIFTHLFDVDKSRLIEDFGGYPGLTFFSWMAHRQGFLGWTAEEQIQDVPKDTIWSIDLLTGKHTALIRFPVWEGSLVSITGAAQSPSGEWMIDAIAYQRAAGYTHQTTAIIGLSDTKTGQRSIICQTEEFYSPGFSGQTWSPDEKQLMFIAGNRDENTSANKAEYWLWSADIAAKRCERRAFVRTGPGYHYPGGFVTDWSPDGKAILFVQGSDSEANPLASNVALFDLQTNQVTLLTHETDAIITFARFMPDGKHVAYSIQKGEYGEIWALDLQTGDSYPIAGPTLIDAPFVVLPVN